MSEIKRYSLKSDNPHTPVGCVVENPTGYLCYFDDHLADVEQREKAHAAEVERLKERNGHLEEEISALRHEFAANDAEIAKLKTAVFDTMNASPREQTEMHDPVEHIKTHFVPVWKYNELVDEIAALRQALDEATLCDICNGDVESWEGICVCCDKTGRRYDCLSDSSRALCERLEREVWSKKS